MKDISHSLLKLIEILSVSPKNLQELSAILEISTKQVGRNIQRLEDKGYLIDKNQNNRYFIFGADSIRNRVLNEQEQDLVVRMLTIYSAFHPLYASIVMKLKSTNLNIPLPPQTKDILKSKNYELINYALAHNVQIILRNYVSPNSPKSAKDRLVEPLLFREEHSHLIAYEISSRLEKTFKLERIGQVILTNENVSGRELKKKFVDPFGFPGAKQMIVKLKLSLLAKEIMSENHPSSRPYIIYKDKDWFYHGPCCSFVAIGRFILGLPGEVTVLYSPTLKAYLLEQIKKFDI